MNSQAQRSLIMDAYNKIFASKAAQTDITQINVSTDMGLYPGRTFVSGVLRGFDVSFRSAKDGSVKNYRFIEQNPFKPSDPGRRAANGAQIMWAIDRDTNQFPFRVERGEIIMGNNPAFVPVAQVQNQTASASVSLPPVELLPEIPGDMSEAVIRALVDNDDYEEGEWDGSNLPADDMYKY
jgi:hypothetical protein